MSFTLLLISSSLLLAYSMKLHWRLAMKAGLITTMIVSAVTLLVDGGWQLFIANCTSSACLIATESDPIFRLLGAMLLLPVTWVPVSAAIVSIEFFVRIVTQSNSSLFPWSDTISSSLFMRLDDFFVIIWSLLVANESGFYTRKFRFLSRRITQLLKRNESDESDDQ